jgi:undecaprenyl-diphosphatase
VNDWTISRGARTGREVWEDVPWVRLGVGWVLAFATGAALAMVLKALGWWHGAAWERDVLVAAHRTVSPALDVIMLSLPFVGTNYSLAPLVAIAAVVLWRRGYPSIALTLLIVQAGSWALNPALKFGFPRDRPTLFEVRGQHAFPAFPSGHAMAVVAVLFTAAYLLHRSGRGTWGYWVVGALLLLNSYSRIYLGAHWPTDVMGGALVGAIWLFFTISALDRLHRPRLT